LTVVAVSTIRFRAKARSNKVRCFSMLSGVRIYVTDFRFAAIAVAGKVSFKTLGFNKISAHAIASFCSGVTHFDSQFVFSLCGGLASAPKPRVGTF
jgi:hypothetical protein